MENKTCKSILIAIIILAAIIIACLFANEQIIKKNGNYGQSFSIHKSTAIQKQLCSNSKYSTISSLSSIDGYGQKIRLDDNSVLLLKKDIIQNKGKISSESFSGLECLEELEINDVGLNDLSEIEKLPNLEILILSGNDLKDLTRISSLKKLKVLDLSNNYKIADLTPLSDLIMLERLFLSSTDISDISSLSKLVNLNELSLSWTKVTDVSPLKPLINLKVLYVREMYILSDNLKTLKDNINLVIIKH